MPNHVKMFVIKLNIVKKLINTLTNGNNETEKCDFHDCLKSACSLR